jgi:prepilin-type N-terminal cleavage/methylation domain-containing protein
MCAASSRPRRGFTLIEVMIALAMLLVGGVGILAVFAVAAAHLVESKVSERLAQVRFEAEAMAQDAVDSMPADRKAPDPVRDRPTSVPGYTVSIDFAKSPNDDPAFVARIRISFRGTETAQGLLPPRFVTRSTITPERRSAAPRGS